MTPLRLCRRIALGLALVTVIPQASLAQEREVAVLVKFRATPEVQRAVAAYTPRAYETSQTRAAKVADPRTGLKAVDAVLARNGVRAKRALVPNGVQDRIRERLGPAKVDRHVDTWTLTEFVLPAGAAVETFIRELAALPEVVYAERKQTYYASPATAEAPPRRRGTAALPNNAATPDDPRFSSLYGQHNTGQTGGTPDADVDAPEAWSIQTGSTDVLVAVIDSGVDYTHPDIAPNIWTNPGEVPDNGLDDDGNGYIDDVHGYDFYHQDSDPMDDNGHGTHVAGTVGAKGNNGIGVVGIAWDVRIVAVKFLGPGGSGSEGLDAVLYAVSNGFPISNNSWGGGGESEAFLDLMQLAEDTNHLFLAASGNDSTDELHYPGAYEYAMAVSSTDHHDFVSGFSNYGTWVDISAPGSSILSTLPGNSYGVFSGTSMATPQVAGAAALLLAEHPDWTAAQIRSRLEETAEDLSILNPGFVGLLGAGRLNVHQALLPAEPRIVSGSVRIDDDQFGASMGNLDGAPGPGETIELRVDLANVGALTAGGVSAQLTSRSAQHAQILSGRANYGDLPFLSAGAQADGPFEVRIADTPPAEVTLDLAVTASGGLSWTLPITLSIRTGASLSGRLTDRGTGLGIANARIAFAGSRSDFVLTEQDGSYEIRDLLTGEITLTASRSGYRSSPPHTTNLSGDSELDLELGTPRIAVTEPGSQALPASGSGAASLEISNPGSDTLTVAAIETPATPPSEIRVAVVRSQSNRDAAQTWAALSAADQPYGPVRLRIDADALANGTITAARLEAINPDVLFIGRPQDGSALSAAERAVISEWVQLRAGVGGGGGAAGGGIVAAAGLDTDRAPDQTSWLAGLMGLEPALAYEIETGSSRFESGPAGGLGRGVAYPYGSAAQQRSRPSANTWQEGRFTAGAAMSTADALGVVATQGRHVFLAHAVESSTRTPDRQLMYNALVHAATDIAWLDLQAGALTVPPGGSGALGLLVGAAQPGSTGTASILLQTNAPASPTVAVPVTLTTENGPLLAVTATAPGTVRAGHSTQVTLEITNGGSLASNPGTLTVTAAAGSAVTISGAQPQLPAIAPGASNTATITVVADPDAPHGTPAHLDLDLPTTQRIRLTTARLSLVEGQVLSATTGQPIENEPVSWTITAGNGADGQTTTGADGTFSAEIADGTYLLRAGGGTHGLSAARAITVPPDTAGLTFRLSRPGLEISTQAIARDLQPWESATEEVMLTSTGDADVTFFAEFVPSGLESRLDELLQNPPEKDPPVPGPVTENVWGRVLILQEEPPLGTEIGEAILQVHGVQYDIMPPAVMGALDLSPYTKVLLSSNQQGLYMDELVQHRAWLEDWVEAGGLLQLHLAFNNIFNQEFIGGFEKTQDFSAVALSYHDDTHPTFTEPSTLSIAEMSPFSPAAEGYFTVLPPTADTLVVWGDTGRPTTVEIPLGGGSILATTVLVEDSRPYLENMLLYGLRRPAWIASPPSPRAGSLAPGASATVEVSLDAAGLPPGTAHEALLRLRTGDAVTPRTTIPVTLTVPEAPTLRIAGTTITDDNDGIADAGETIELTLHLANDGTQAATDVSAAISTSTAGATVLTPQVSVGTVGAGTTGEAGPFAIALSNALADGAEVTLQVALSGAGGLTQTAEASFIVRNDPDAPGTATDLVLVRAYRAGAVVQFTVPGDNGATGDAASALFRFASAPIAGDVEWEAATPIDTVQAGAAGQVIEAELQGLPENGTAHVAFRAVDGAGNLGAVSNSIEITTAAKINAATGTVYAGSDGLVGAGDLLFIDLALTSADGTTHHQVSVMPGSGPHIYREGVQFQAFPTFVGDVGPTATTTQVQLYIASEAPVGTEVVVPIILIGGDGLTLDRAAITLTLETADLTPPSMGDNRLVSRYYPLGADVQFTGLVREPGPVMRVDAVIVEDGEEAARVPMTLNPDADREGEYAGAWVADRIGEFTVRYEITDAAGNEGVSSSGNFQGFTTRVFTPAARNLLVVDAVGGFADSDGLRASAALDSAGLAHDTWRTFVHGRDLPAEVLSAYSGSVVYVAPQGTFSTIASFGAEEMRLALGGHITAGGSVMLSAQNLVAGLDAEWMAEHFGVEAAGFASGTALGLADDPVGDGLAIDLHAPGSPGTQFSPSALAPAGPFATAALDWSGGGAAVVRSDNGTARTVTVGFGIDGIAQEDASVLARRAVHWMSGDPADTTPPAAVNSLRARVEGDAVVLTWNATGDDGRSGRAMGYELRRAASPPGADWSGWWDSATRVAVPRPAEAFTEERVELGGLDTAANHFFLLRAEDDGRNLSPWSNLARVAPGHASAVDLGAELPGEFALHAAYPNPFSGVARVGYDLPVSVATLQIEVFDVLGRRVAVLASGAADAGRHEALLDGARMASGVYFVRMEAGPFGRFSRSVTLVR